MAHKTLIGGTAYKVKGGKTLVGGTAYSIKSGKTLINGTVYDIKFGTPFAVLSTDGSLIFYNRSSVPSVGATFNGKTVSAVYTISETTVYGRKEVPWYSQKSSITSISFASEFASVKPVSTEYWFMTCTSLTSFNSANFNTSSVIKMGFMFSSCSALTSLDLSGFDTSSVTDMCYMFTGCTSLKTIYASSGWSTASVTDSTDMFYNCTSLKGDIAYNSSYIDKTYAKTSGGYLTYKAAP